MAFTTSAQAGITITFAQQGNDVVATAAGTYIFPDSSTWLGDVAFSPRLTSGNANIIGDFFGFVAGSPGRKLICLEGVDDDAAPALNQVYNVNHTWTWANTTLGADLEMQGTGSGLGVFTSTPTVVITAADIGADNNISVAVIPEPSAFALWGLGGLALLARRRRIA